MTIANFMQSVLKTPVWGLLATLAAYQIGLSVNQLAKGNVLANPVLVSVLLLVVLLKAAHIPYDNYFAGARFVHFLLGPATVALALPMYCNRHHIRRTAAALVPALIAGSVVSAGAALLIGKFSGAAPVVTTSLIAHSATTPIAMSISAGIGGSPALAATFTLLTGIMGVLLIRVVSAVMRVTDARAQGLAAGTAGHGLTTAHMLAINETAGAFGGLAIGMNGVLTAILAPLLVSLMR
ncbi:LrgB family protein [Burkholderia sp. Ac-20384]|uniref:LrgB family protein n=1 Tax=Burkholderia sp. Ac-20384 TaxID=2703902 RepID=UPI0019810B78|nr:LrgB family protein [Burkholderia sp. Ac-20384]MBN3827521.1 LrgB family protein [Burkholderia sp. Ac-20384]